MPSDTTDGRSGGRLSPGFQRATGGCRAPVLRTHQDGFEVAVEKVLERRQEVDGGTLDQLPAGAADLLLRLAAFDQSVPWKGGGGEWGRNLKDHGGLDRTLAIQN